jgi:photosystem II stability/assembly factor-like uncharacterized protein
MRQSVFIWLLGAVSCVDSSTDGALSCPAGGRQANTPLPTAGTSGAPPGAAGTDNGTGGAASSGFELVDTTTLPPTPYRYRPVAISGGGFVTGLSYHPSEPGLLYAYTDIGGAFRWDAVAETWVPMLDWVSHDVSHLMGIESLALDPSHPDRIYLAAGMYVQDFAPLASILRSDDRGATWEVLPAPFKTGSNEPGRGIGERLAVDPHDPEVLFFGSRSSGLWKSTDRATSWTKVDSFPGGNTANSLGAGSVLFDAERNLVYAAVARQGESLYRSADGGQSWSLVPGAPEGMMPHRAALVGSTLVLTFTDSPGPYEVHAGSVYKLDVTTDTWTNITPLPDEEDFGYGGVAVDPLHPDVMLVATLNRYWSHEEILRTTDGGATWSPIVERSTWDKGGVGFLGEGPGFAGNWMVDLKMNPHDPGEAIFVTGFGVWKTSNLDALDESTRPNWVFSNRGLENTAVEDLLSPASGEAHLVSVVGDVGGFWHVDLDRTTTSAHQNPVLHVYQGLDYAGNHPERLVRVGYDFWSGVGLNAGMSTDSGQTWTPLPWIPQGILNRKSSLAFGADGESMVWMAPGGQAYRTADGGQQWIPCRGLPPFNGSRIQWTDTDPKVAADRVNAQLYYALDVMGGAFYLSVDGGATFAPTVTNLPRHPDYLARYASVNPVRGREGDLWLTTQDGLYHSTNSGRTFARLKGIATAYGLAMGQAAGTSDYPTLYVAGALDRQSGVFRSDDGGANWSRINDAQQQFGGPEQVEGDPRVPGRVYLGTSGRGIFYGDPL